MLKAGFGRVELTPEVGHGIAGYSLCSPHAHGWYGRLNASALVIRTGPDSRTDVALVTVDLHGGSRWIAEEAAHHLRMPRNRILLVGTHTHLGPAGIYGERAYDSRTSRLGRFQPAVAERAARAVALAVSNARGTLRDTQVRIGSNPVWGPFWQRSANALRWNRLPSDAVQDADEPATPPGSSMARDAALARWLHGVTPPGDLFTTTAPPQVPSPATGTSRNGPPMDHEDWLESLRRGLHDPTEVLQALTCKASTGSIESRFERALAWNQIQCIVADDVGAFVLVPGTPTMLGFEYGVYSSDVLGAVVRRVEASQSLPVAVGSGVIGDVNLVAPDRPVENLLASRVDLGRMLEQVNSAATAIATGVSEALVQASPVALSAIRCVLDYPRLAGAQFPYQGRTRQVADTARFGPELERGGELGPGQKGSDPRGPAAFDPDDPQSPKPNWVFGGLRNAPKDVAVHALHFETATGTDTLLLASPGELGSGLARVITDRLRSETNAREILLAGPAGGYLSYFCTAWTYRGQEYEGSATVYGRWSGAWLEEQFSRLAAHPTDHHGTPPAFSIRGPRQRYRKVLGVPLPSPTLVTALDGPESGLLTERQGTALLVTGWWRPKKRHGARGPRPDGAWIELTVDGQIFDDTRSEIAVLRMGRGRRSRWAFVARLENVNDGGVRFRYLGPPDHAPRQDPS